MALEEKVERPLTSLFTDLMRESSTLVQQEIALAKAEVTEKAAQAGKSIAALAVGGAVAFIGLLFVLLGVTYFLVEVVEWPRWVSALVVGLVVAAIGGLLLMKGRRDMEADKLKPQKTLHSLQADKRLVKEHLA